MSVIRVEISDKLIRKWNKELIELHKNVIKSYLVSRGIKYPTRARIFKLYDYYINDRNIRSYFFTPTGLLIRSMVRGNIDKVSTLIFPENKNGKRKRRTRNTNKG